MTATEARSLAASLAGIKDAAGDVGHGLSDSTALETNSPLPLMSLSSSLAQGACSPTLET
jgi:hypothetical protein